MKIDELNLKPQILNGLKKMGFSDLTPIQEATYEHILAGRDLVGLAETGSGKTAAVGIPVVQSVDPDLDAVQSLIIVPTRELALQYVSEVSDIAKLTDVAAFAVYGGFDMNIQLGKLEHGVQILVATPGRLIDLLYNSPLRLNEVRTLVLDEADEMLNMGFVTDIEFVMSCLVHEHQTLLFSATMPKEIKQLTSKYLKDPVEVELIEERQSPQSLEHQFEQVSKNDHFDKLLNVLKQDDLEQAIVFCNSRRTCENVFKKLKHKIDSAEIIHGGIDQSKRTSLFNRFKKKKVKVMIATDIAGRGLDFSHTSHVINYDFPKGPEPYTHRTGRTARMGRRGVAVTFYGRGDLRALKSIIRKTHIKPVWRGEAPDLDKIGGGRGRSGGRSQKRSRRR
ncbi:DEAD-box ATP-dependent RNA helicase CshA [Anaerohalosphaera lusitana]|uniref:DEAD-box ATP-dependent RNA helicase CshA n=1 Tax=Anaerohalosphaera lusitana TaxID=1936003 RepID=A0A1U9NMX4_9BACT|nr:DEAD/DEAH box helicase [Anaerohalosphaera lusitana]AQT69263.1 DEAD-box ATP-dependent RNA helicase CshA [Anaerohalosphaera lusitana]